MVQPHTSRRILRREIRAGLVATERHERSFGDPSLEDAAGNRPRRRQCGPSSSPVASRSSSRLVRPPCSTFSCSKARLRRSPRLPFASMSRIGRIIQRPKRARDFKRTLYAQHDDVRHPWRTLRRRCRERTWVAFVVVVAKPVLLHVSASRGRAGSADGSVGFGAHGAGYQYAHGSGCQFAMPTRRCFHRIQPSAGRRPLSWVLSESGLTGWCVSLCNQRPSGLPPVGREHGKRWLTL